MGEEKARAQKQKESEKEEMRDRLIELIGSKVCEAYSPTCDEWQPHSCEKCFANSCRIGDLADHLLANGVIVPPVGIGQTVYCIRYDKARKPFVKPLEIRSITTYGIGKFSVFTTRDDTWGVTAFATEEEAEKALERSGE